jgi:hypothetical protein
MPNVMRGSTFPAATAIDVVDTRPAPSTASSGAPRRDQLQAIDALMGATVADALAGARSAAAPPAGGTQAVLDHLEHLGDMRDRGLLTPSEYETAKEAVMRELGGHP